MNTYKIYKHFIATNAFNVKAKIDTFRKPAHANKNRKRKD